MRLWPPIGVRKPPWFTRLDDQTGQPPFKRREDPRVVVPAPMSMESGCGRIVVSRSVCWRHGLDASSHGTGEMGARCANRELPLVGYDAPRLRRRLKSERKATGPRRRPRLPSAGRRRHPASCERAGALRPWPSRPRTRARSRRRRRPPSSRRDPRPGAGPRAARRDRCRPRPLGDPPLDDSRRGRPVDGAGPGGHRATLSHPGRLALTARARPRIPGPRSRVQYAKEDSHG
jgi:hypothetical protein